MPDTFPRRLFWSLLSFYFIFLGYEVLHTDYLFTDEAYRLWNNVDREGVFHSFHTEGRTLGGLMVRWLFERCHSAADVKYIRLLSLGECLLMLLVLYRVLKRLQRRWMPALSDELIYTTLTLAAASLSIANWISWAVSTIIFIPAILSLIAGMILYESVQRDREKASFPGLPALLAVILLSVTGLFFYQTPYPFLLLPFYLLFLLKEVPGGKGVLPAEPVLPGGELKPDGLIGTMAEEKGGLIGTRAGGKSRLVGPVAAGSDALLIGSGNKFPGAVYIGILVYFIILGVYFALFRFGLKVMGMAASERTALATDPLERLSFFFSYPMNQAFNGNFLFDVKSVVSQMVFPVLFLAWVIALVRSARVADGQSHSGKSHFGKSQWMHILRTILLMLAFWGLGFLPQLAGHEAFAPYRTMLVMTVMVFVALVYTALSLIRTSPGKVRFSFYLILVLLGKGAYNYKVYLADPLGKEYQVIRQAVNTHYNNGVREVVFIRPSDHGFEKSLGIGSFKDEFGLPSTQKDWTPEPLVRQLVYELTGSRARAEALKLTQYASVEEYKGEAGDGKGSQASPAEVKPVTPEEWKDSAVLNRDNILYINAPKLLNELHPGQMKLNTPGS